MQNRVVYCKPDCIYGRSNSHQIRFCNVMDLIPSGMVFVVCCGARYCVVVLYGVCVVVCMKGMFL